MRRVLSLVFLTVLSTSVVSVCGCPLADLNADGTVDILDLTIVGQAFGAEYKYLTQDSYWHDPPCKDCPHPTGSDVNSDGIINILDIAKVASDFGKTG